MTDREYEFHCAVRMGKEPIHDYVPFEKAEPDINYTDEVITKLAEDEYELKKVYDKGRKKILPEMIFKILE